ncbi:MAG: hypothetical protein ACRCTQ_04325 [Brevinemataceae bacterium]
MLRILSLSIIIFSTVFPSFASISKLPTYPSGIKVSFKVAVPEKKEVEKKEKKKKSWRLKKKKKNKQASETASVQETKPISYTNFTRFIRVINAINNLTEKEYLAILFFNEKNQLIDTQAVLNTDKPSPTYIFFIDKKSNKLFKGKLDVYFIPEDTKGFQIAVIDSKNNIITTLSHPNLPKNNIIPISEFDNLGGKNKVMLQFEVVGSKEALTTRISAFRF